MAWRRPGDKPLSEPMMVSLPTRICVTRPQWVKVNPCPQNGPQAWIYWPVFDKCKYFSWSVLKNYWNKSCPCPMIKFKDFFRRYGPYADDNQYEILQHLFKTNPITHCGLVMPYSAMSDSPHKGPVMWKLLSCHDILMFQIGGDIPSNI